VAAFDFVQTQAEAKALLVEFGAIDVAVSYKDDPVGTGATATIAVFGKVSTTNIENRGNPTVIAAAKQIAYIPGDIPWAPSVGDTIAFTGRANDAITTVKKRVSAVDTLMPDGNTPILYTVTLENG
jgi:hypothetical protein